MLFMPLTWLIVAGLVWYFVGWPWAIVSIPASFLCGYAALYSLEEATEMRGWARAVWLFLTQREKFLRAYVERRELFDQLKRFSENGV